MQLIQGQPKIWLIGLSLIKVVAGQIHFSSKYRSSDNKFDVCSSLTKVAVSDDGNVWGVNRQQNIYRWLGSTWQHIGGKAIEVR